MPAEPDVSLILYAADLEDLRGWVGCADERRFREAWGVVREDPDSDWEPQELEVLRVLLRRLIFDGALYDQASPDERYYLTQLLIDLFDEYADPDALSDDLPLEPVRALVEGLPAEAKAARWLVRGRELGGDGLLWTEGPVGDHVAFMGYVRRDEAGGLAQALGSARPRGGPPGRRRGREAEAERLLKVIREAAAECARAELDLVSFVG